MDHIYDNIQESFKWLTNGRLFPETEGFYKSIQDQIVPTRNYIMREENITISTNVLACCIRPDNRGKNI